MDYKMTKELNTKYEDAKKNLAKSTGVSEDRQDLIMDFVIKKDLLTEKVGKKDIFIRREELVNRIMDNEELCEREKIFCAVFASSLLESERQEGRAKQLLKSKALQQMRQAENKNSSNKIKLILQV